MTISANHKQNDFDPKRLSFSNISIVEFSHAPLALFLKE